MEKLKIAVMRVIFGSSSLPLDVVSLVKELQFVPFYPYMMPVPNLFTPLYNAEVSPRLKTLRTEKLLLYLGASNHSDRLASTSHFDNQTIDVFPFSLKFEKKLRNS